MIVLPILTTSLGTFLLRAIVSNYRESAETVHHGLSWNFPRGLRVVTGIYHFNRQNALSTRQFRLILKRVDGWKVNCKGLKYFLFLYFVRFFAIFGKFRKWGCRGTNAPGWFLAIFLAVRISHNNARLWKPLFMQVVLLFRNRKTALKIWANEIPELCSLQYWGIPQQCRPNYFGWLGLK